ncbi:ABC transporter permease subunit [Plantactinospora sp. S1510]|uniref:ABC transporter permease subunit n=1 Tax=Plantactinospora alkalitolerans TaxID=2789879 RepID=A0ABS0GS81_9ACTN|nr:ABC transporter permease subunit [Plantactinospora alkalitolerans]MBF9129056.1 ABC transporter permease subunit [Plantactinospora alkalitolerans]
MLWLTWRQHRWQLIGVAVVVAVYCGYLVYAGLQAHQASQVLDACSSGSGAGLPSPSCESASSTVNDVHSSMINVVTFGNLLPLAVGMFWGAPLISRELEQGTYRLTFTQTVSRRRWLAVKLGILSGAAALLGTVTGAVVSWSQQGANEPFGDDRLFSQAGAVPAATWVFALLTGATLGLLRRTTAAIAVTLVALPLVFAGLLFLRPHYLPPAERLVGGSAMIQGEAPSNDPRGWLFSVSYLDRTGRELSPSAAGTVCADPANTFPSPQCLDRTGLRQRIVYHPTDRYPWFQLIEMGILLTAAGAMALVIRWRVSRHLV